MKKKQANPYKKSKLISQPPYLTAQQIKQFQSQFKLFNQQVDLKKLKQTLISLRNQSQYKKPVEQFVQTFFKNKSKCDFEEYMKQMVNFLSKQDQGDLIVKMLGQYKNNDICIELIKQIIQESIGRDIMQKQMKEIIGKLFDQNNFVQWISQKKIKQLLISTKIKI